MAYKTIAFIVASEMCSSGLILTIRTRDETQKEFRVGLAINSSFPQAVAAAQAKLAQICRACDVSMIVDTETLHHIDFIFEHNGADYVSAQPIKVTIERLVPIGVLGLLKRLLKGE